ncbi:MAG: RNA polymerase sigma factor [Myxococcota bacterium]
MDQTQLAALYQQYGYYVHRRCMALLGSSADADDALQEVFLRVQRYGRSDATGSDLGWLYAIATRVCFDLRQKKTPEAVDPAELPALETRAEAASPDTRAAIGLALRSMDQKVAELGVLHHLDGYTQEELEARLGISRKTIGKKLALFDALVREVATKLRGVAS